MKTLSEASNASGFIRTKLWFYHENHQPSRVLCKKCFADIESLSRAWIQAPHTCACLSCPPPHKHLWLPLSGDSFCGDKCHLTKSYYEQLDLGISSRWSLKVTDGMILTLKWTVVCPGVTSCRSRKRVPLSPFPRPQWWSPTRVGSPQGECHLTLGAYILPLDELTLKEMRKVLSGPRPLFQ